MPRHTRWTWALGQMLALSLAALLLPAAAGGAPFTVIMLPDTQHYSEDDTLILQFDAQTQWIVDNLVAETIVFSTLVGDVVENGGGGANIIYLTLATAFVEDPPDTFLNTAADPLLLVAGDNVVAVEIHQSEVTSSDISFDLSLSATGIGMLIPVGANWLYLDDGSDQGTAWRASGFADGGWASGPAELGYGDGDEATVVGFGPDPNNKYVTTYFRHHFNVVDPGLALDLTLNLERDDGAIVYLNGAEIFRTNLPGQTSGNQAEWDRVVSSLDILDGDLQMNPDGHLPYAAVAGNHDLDEVDNKATAFQYIVHLGPARYQGRSWFVGSDASQINMAQTFVGNGQTYLNLGLEWKPSDTAIEWAQGVIAANPQVPTIITTHEHLLSGPFAFRTLRGATPDDTGDNTGDDVYEKLVEPFPQVFLVLSGHNCCNGRNESTTVFGQTVHEILADYQSDPNGGNGWLQKIEFRPDALPTGELVFETVSPTYIPGTTPGPNRSVDADSNFSLLMDLNEHVAYLETTAIVHFREGQDHGFGVYTATQDTHIGDGDDGFVNPNQSYGDEEQIHADGDGDNEQGLVRFDGIVGQAPGQIPPGTPLDLALVTFTTEGFAAESPTGAEFHRMLVPWTESTTWDDLMGGVQVDGIEAVVAVDADAAGEVDTKSTDSFDVTAGVQAWVDGASNYGWVLTNAGADGWRPRSSDWEGVLERPMLTVSFAAGCNDGIDNDGDGLTDSAQDTGCADANDGWETDVAQPCDDGIDNDGDGDIDFPADPGCALPTWPGEGPQCDDGIDNDFDGLIDWDGYGGLADPQCSGPLDNSEAPACAVGFELLPVLGLLLAVRRRRQSPRGP